MTTALVLGAGPLSFFFVFFAFVFVFVFLNVPVTEVCVCLWVVMKLRLNLCPVVMKSGSVFSNFAMSLGLSKCFLLLSVRGLPSCDLLHPRDVRYHIGPAFEGDGRWYRAAVPMFSSTPFIVCVSVFRHRRQSFHCVYPAPSLETHGAHAQMKILGSVKRT